MGDTNEHTLLLTILSIVSVLAIGTFACLIREFWRFRVISKRRIMRNSRSLEAGYQVFLEPEVVVFENPGYKSHSVCSLNLKPEDYIFKSVILK